MYPVDISKVFDKGKESANIVEHKELWRTIVDNLTDDSLATLDKIRNGDFITNNERHSLQEDIIETAEVLK